MPLLVPVEEDRLSFYFRDEDDIVDKHAVKVLHLVNAVLPKDAKNWPYGVYELLTRLEKADDSIGTDPVYLRLIKKHESR